MISSITVSTLKQYESALKMWWEFAHDRGLDVYNAPTSDFKFFYQTDSTTEQVIKYKQIGYFTYFFKGYLSKWSYSLVFERSF